MPVCHFLKWPVWICMWSDAKCNTSQLDIWNGSAPWYFHHSDISGFYFLSNCTAWCVLRGFHENDESPISTMLQLWGKYGNTFWARFTVELTRIIGIENRNGGAWVDMLSWKRLLAAKIFNTPVYQYWSTPVLFWSSAVAKFPKQWYLLYSTYNSYNLSWHHMLVGNDNL